MRSAFVVPAWILVPLAFGGASRSQEPTSQKYAGTAVCAECHDTEYESFRKSIHHQIETFEEEVGGCESCHGPGAEHVDTDGEAPMPRFDERTAMTGAERTAACMDCHGGRTPTFVFEASEHKKGDVDCAMCHKIHEAAGQDQLVMGRGFELCLSCHQEIRTATNLNERHRILEGMVDCTDCHEQHRPSQRARLGGFKQESCFECHTDKQGPFVFEHGGIRVEGCTSCHDPHGSTNRHMLLYQSTANLCFSCHVVVPGFHMRFDVTTNCTNCHTEIHGSNLDPFFLR